MHEYVLLIYILKFNDVIEYLRDRLIDYRLARRSRTSSCILNFVKNYLQNNKTNIIYFSNQ